jgi:NDP-sugar pyrophosphorylase family protein
MPPRQVIRDMGDVSVRASEVHVSCGLLYDLVFLAGGPASKLSPLCNETAKPMLSIGNRPLITYVVRPWVEKGARTMFICAHDYAMSAMQIALERDFPNVLFKFVTVAADRPANERAAGDNDDDGLDLPTTSCDALTAFYAAKKALRIEGVPEGLPRDVLVVSGDTILAKVDIEPFIDNFYSSFSSANVLLWRPKQVDKTAAAPEPKKGTKTTKPAHKFPDKKAWQHDFACVGYEETLPSALASSSAVGHPDGVLVSHHRLHYIQPYEDAPTPTLSMGFAARRPNLTFCADVVDAHVYLLKQWVVEFVANIAKNHPMLDDIASLRLDIIPLLARSQHALVRSEERKFITPFEKLLVEKMPAAIGADWATDLSSTRSIGSLNAARLSSNPTAPPCTKADALRVTCTIYQEAPIVAENLHSIRRVNTRDNYLALHHEVLQMLPPHGAPANADDVTAIGIMCLDQFADEHDSVISSIPAAFSSHVSQSLLRSAPAHAETYITRSIVGQRVVLGKGVRITNSIIGDNVELEDNTTIVNSVLGGGVVVKAGVRIASCFAAPQVLVAKDASDMVVTTEDD